MPSGIVEVQEAVLSSRIQALQLNPSGLTGTTRTAKDLDKALAHVRAIKLHCGADIVRKGVGGQRTKKSP